MAIVIIKLRQWCNYFIYIDILLCGLGVFCVTHSIGTLKSFGDAQSLCIMGGIISVNLHNVLASFDQISGRHYPQDESLFPIMLPSNDWRSLLIMDTRYTTDIYFSAFLLHNIIKPTKYPNWNSISGYMFWKNHTSSTQQSI